MNQEPQTSFLHLGKLSVLVTRSVTLRQMGLPRYISIPGRGGHRRIFSRLYWLVNDYRRKDNARHWWMIGNP